MILDWDVAHPLMQYVRDLSTVVDRARPPASSRPPGSTVLIESNLGPLAFVAPREGYSDTVVTFPLVDGDDVQHDLVQEHQLPALPVQQPRRSLGNVRESAGDEVHLPGQTVVLRAETAGRRRSRSPAPTARRPRPSSGRRRATLRLQQGRHDRASTTPAGARIGLLPFAVNLFDPRESDLAPRGLVPDGHAARQGRGLQDQDRLQPRRRHPKPPGPAARTGGCRSPSLALGVAAARVVHLQPAGLRLTDLL